jgi:hypothetical protein
LVLLLTTVSCPFVYETAHRKEVKAVGKLGSSDFARGERMDSGSLLLKLDDVPGDVGIVFTLAKAVDPPGTTSIP